MRRSAVGGPLVISLTPTLNSWPCLSLFFLSRAISRWVISYSTCNFLHFFICLLYFFFRLRQIAKRTEAVPINVVLCFIPKLIKWFWWLFQFFFRENLLRKICLIWDYKQFGIIQIDRFFGMEMSTGCKSKEPEVIVLFGH